MNLDKYRCDNYVWKQQRIADTTSGPILVSPADGRRVAVVLAYADAQSLTTTTGVVLGTVTAGVHYSFMAISQGLPFAVITREDIGKLITSALYLGDQPSTTINVVVTEILDNTPPGQ